VLIQADALHTHTAFVRQLTEQGADFLLSAKANEITLVRQIDTQFQGKHQIPFTAMHPEIGHGREIIWATRGKEAPEHIKVKWPGSAWIVELIASGSRDGKPLNARHIFISSLHNSPEALLRLKPGRSNGALKAGAGCATRSSTRTITLTGEWRRCSGYVAHRSTEFTASG
jgi:hypothetical protein